MKKKKLKGMTLMEVIIAMVIMAICGSLLVEACVCVVNNTRTARRVTSKVDEQATVIENRPDEVTAYQEKDTIELKMGAQPAVTMVVDKFEAPTTQVSEEQRAGNLKYFVPSPTATP